MTRLVLFDIDGTLVLTGRAGEKAFGRVCEAAFGVSDATRHLNFAGRTDPGIVRDFFLLNRIDPSAENFARFFRDYLVALELMLPACRGNVLPGVTRLIGELRALPAPPTLGLLTGNIRQGALRKLTHYRLWDEFALGAFGDDHEDRNQVAMVARRRASDHAGRPLRGEEIVVVGDTPRDIECARAIEARCLAVATGSFSMNELKAHGPEWTVPTLETIAGATLCAAP
jgi:phosphoglycolate phosphatase-like HAD superfamily hydrolase